MKQYWKKTVRLGIQKKLTFATVFLVVIPMIMINMFYFRNSEKIALMQILKSDQQVLSLSGNNIANFIEEMIAVSNIICFDKELSSMLIKKEPGEKLAYSDIVKVDHKLVTAQMPLLGFYSTANLYNIKGERLSTISIANEGTINMIYQTDILDDAVKKQGHVVWVAPHQSQKGSKFISLARTITNTSKSKEKQIILIITVDEKEFCRKFLSGLNFPLKGESVFVVNPEGQIISHAEKDDIGGNIHPEWVEKIKIYNQQGYFISEREGEKHLVSYVDIPLTTWKLIKITDYYSQLSGLTSVTMESIVFILLMLLIFYFVTLIISTHITAPIKKLQKQMENVDNIHLEQIEVAKGGDEVEELGHGYNRMIGRINELVERFRLEHESKEQLRLELMQAQVNPHFIFNALNAIKWTAVINNVPDIAELIVDFGRIVAMSIKDIDKLIPLKDEISNLNSYIKIQKRRYNYPINICLNTDGSDIVALVPKLILQPIVENSIIHGFDDSYVCGLNININIAIIDTSLCILIKDDGKGIERENLEQIKADLALQMHKNRMGGIGLQNVHKRLQLLFGDRYGIDIASEHGKGTIVTLILPTITEEGKGA